VLFFLRPTSRWRLVGDTLWLLAFGVVLALLVARSRASSMLRDGVALELVAGVQQRAVFRGDRRLGRIEERVERVGQHWRVRQRFWVEEPRRGDGPPGLVGEVTLRLQADLTLLRLNLWAEPGKLPAPSSFSRGLLRALGDRVEVQGQCDPQRGSCRVRGRIGGLPIDERMQVGRGPVLPGAVYPLLARGVLGRRTELSIFDPLTMRARIVSYEVGPRREIALRSGRYRAVRVMQDVDGLRTELWIDERGRPLLQRLPFGVTVEHEAFGAALR
jgi:hypothetical protein